MLNNTLPSSVLIQQKNPTALPGEPQRHAATTDAADLASCRALKAYVLIEAAGRTTPAEADRLAAHLLRDFVPNDRLGWHETLTREGVPTMTDLPASTPFHVFLATIEAERLVPTYADGPVMSRL